MRITDIKEMIVTHLTLLSLGTPVSMKHQSDSAAYLGILRGGWYTGALRLSHNNNQDEEQLSFTVT